MSIQTDILQTWNVLLSDRFRWNHKGSEPAVLPGRAHLSVQVNVKSVAACSSSLRVHCTDLLFWALGMQAQWFLCAPVCPCLLRLPSVYFFFFLLFFSSRRGQEQPMCVSSSSSMINKLGVSPGQVPGQPPRSVPTPRPAFCHSAVGMMLTWFCCRGPDAFSELRFSSLLMMSVHVFLYWWRSSEYTKGSQAALL